METQKELAGLRRLERRWVMTLANTLYWREHGDQSERFKQALMAFRILDGLGKGKVRFVYKKEDGTERDALGTLHRGISYDFDQYEVKGKSNHSDNSNTEGTYTYWDLEACGFRTFKAQNLVRIIEIVIPLDGYSRAISDLWK